MGEMIKTNEHYEYRQDSGETTAWFPDAEEKMVLAHDGSPFYKKVFYILISTGMLYLLIVFLFVH